MVKLSDNVHPSPKGDNQKWKFVEVPVAQVEKKAAP